MYGHELEKDDKGYTVSLFKRHYFMKKKMVEVVSGIESKEDAVTLCSMLDGSLKNGMWIASKGEKNGKV